MAVRMSVGCRSIFTSFSEHLIDWFHITMRLTVSSSRPKALRRSGRRDRRWGSKQLESVKHLLWHGNTEEAWSGLEDLVSS